MRRIAIGVTMVVLVLASAPTAGAARAHRRAAAKCPPGQPGHSQLITADAQAQIYEVLGVNGGSEVFGCAYGRRPYALGLPLEGSASGGGGVDMETLGGPIAAYEESSSKTSPPSGKGLVIVRDLRSGRVLHRVPTGTPTTPSKAEVGVGPVVAIVVKGDGAVAWIAENVALGKSPGSGYHEVHSLDKAGGRVLAAGADIDPHSLALAGSTIYWTQGGKPMSATLN